MVFDKDHQHTFISADEVIVAIAFSKDFDHRFRSEIIEFIRSHDMPYIILE